jgi:hypothetical protein
MSMANNDVIDQISQAHTKCTASVEQVKLEVGAGVAAACIAALSGFAYLTRRKKIPTESEPFTA